MSVLGWCFIALNIVVCVACLWTSISRRNALGERVKWTRSSNVIWLWQLLGVALVLSLKLNPLHLIWWFVVGYTLYQVRGLRTELALASKMPALYQNWPQALLSLAALRRKDFVFRLRQGVKFSLHTRSMDTYITNEIWKDKIYTPSSTFTIRDGWVVVDLGGHKGIFSVFAATRAKDVKVYSFEASPDNFASLSRNVRLNNLSNVKAFNVAVGGQDGESILNLYGENGQNTLLQRSNPQLQPVNRVKVEIWSLAKVLKTVASPVDLLKVDIEGMEYEALFSCPDEYLRRVARIALEYHDVLVRVPHTVDDLIQFLTVKGFATRLSAGNEILLAERTADTVLPRAVGF